MPDKLKIIYTTVGSESEAEALARALVSERLAACANILTPIRSIFRWEGKLTDEAEVAILFKTRAGKAKAAMMRIAELHSYDVPGIELWAVEDAPAPFRKWVEEETC